MIWWLKTRRVHPLLTGGSLVFAVLTILLQDSTILLPALSITGGNPTALSFFVPVVVVGTLAQVLDNRLVPAEESGVRAVRWMDVLLITGVMATTLVITLTGGWFTGSEAVVQAGRNTCFLTGLMLIARAFFQRSGILLPLAWIFTVVFAGRSSGTEYHAWAVTALPADNRSAAVATAVAVALGLVLTHRARTRI